MKPVASWAELEAQAPELAGAGRRLLRADAVPIGFLATTAADGRPRVAPVCPVFAAGALHLSVGRHTPKLRDLRQDGRFALHAFLGAHDEEFQVTGRASEVIGAAECAAVRAAIRFAHEAEDPIFRLDLAQATWVSWENPGRPEMRARRRRWTAASRRVRETVWAPRAARAPG